MGDMTEMMFREMTPTDLPAVTAMLQRAMEFDEFPGEALVAEKTTAAADFDPALSAVLHDDDGDGAPPRPIAMAMAALGQGEGHAAKGYVRLMAVSRAHRSRGIGNALLAEMERRLAERGATTVAIFDCPHNYLVPGVDFRYTHAHGLLLKRGYAMHRENHDMLAPLHPDAWPDLDAEAAAQTSAGLHIRRAAPADKPAIDAFLDAHWPAWRFEVHAALANHPVSLHLAFRGDAVVAFSGYQGNNRTLPWFGPMGTCPTLRGKGIGAILLKLCLRDLACQGWPEAIIPWVGPVGFYAKHCAARLDRCFWAYRKMLA